MEILTYKLTDDEGYCFLTFNVLLGAANSFRFWLSVYESKHDGSLNANDVVKLSHRFCSVTTYLNIKKILRKTACNSFHLVEL